MLSEETAILPDTAEIRRDLEFMTARWQELGIPVKFEIRAFKENAQPQTARFSPDWIDDAVDWCENMNSLGFNIYAVRNPIRGDISGSASDTDIVAAFFLWADCDDLASAGNVYRFDGPKWTAAVTTGRTPSVRVHVYWQLEKPCTDLAQWRSMQETIASHFGSDKTVVNPSRIMRVGGTVSYPAKRKQERGYIKEVTTVRTEYPNEARHPVTLDQMRRVFGSRGNAGGNTGGNIGDFQNPPHIAVNDEDRKTASDYANILRRARTDGEKHSGVRDLAASLAGSGVSRKMAEAIIHEACPVWDANVENLIDSAYRKYFKPDTPQERQAVITDLHIQSSSEFLSDLSPPVYVVDGVLAEKRCHSLTGFAGHGKTTLALHLAICVATGSNFADKECVKGACLVLAGENPDNVKWQYAAAIAAVDQKASDLAINFLPGHFQLSSHMDALRQKAAAIPDLKLIIIDSLQAFFEGENDNGNVEMVDAARRFRTLTDLPSKPSVIVIAHPAGKKPDKGNIVPRGGSGFGNEMDGNYTVWAEPDGTQTFHHSEKHRGAPFEPMAFVMEDREFDHLKDAKGNYLRLKVSRQQLLIEQANAAAKSESRELDAIRIIDSNPKTTVRSLAEALRVSRSTAGRVMDTLKDEKLIRRHAKKWVLTTGGEEFRDGE